MEIEENIPLKPLTTFKIGGPARYFTTVTNLDELRESLDFARDKNQRTLIFGGGSNVLIDDAGFDGLVIKIEIKGIERMPAQSGDENTLIAAAGESWDALVSRAIHENLWGLENLSGIPGSVGGAVAGSIGAYGQALSQTCVWVKVLDEVSGEVTKLSNAECEFGYRSSIFSRNAGKFVIIRAAFALSNKPKPDLSYKDLAERFKGQMPALQDIREAILAIRKAKFPDLNVEGTAGSFFKNPIFLPSEAVKLKEKYPQIPIFEMPETAGVKIPLAWLLDRVLNMKGMRQGRARLFEMQPLVIVAEKDCSANDVRTLAKNVQKKVFDELKIQIEPEVKIIL